MPVTDDGLERILSHDTIAVVGCSTTPGKAAHDVPAYLQRHGYRIVPVNPFADEVLDEPAYDSLATVPDSIDVGVVDVFRPSEEAGGIVDGAIERAAAAGLDFVQDACLKVEHRRLRG